MNKDVCGSVGGDVHKYISQVQGHRFKDKGQRLKAQGSRRKVKKLTILLVQSISYIPGVDWQSKVLNSGIEPDPIFPILHCFQYKDNFRLPISLQSIISALAHRFILK